MRVEAETVISPPRKASQEQSPSPKRMFSAASGAHLKYLIATLFAKRPGHHCNELRVFLRIAQLHSQFDQPNRPAFLEQLLGRRGQCGDAAVSIEQDRGAAEIFHVANHQFRCFPVEGDLRLHGA